MLYEKSLPRMRTIKEAAGATGLSYYCVRRMCQKCEIRYIKSGNRYLVNLDLLVGYLNGNLVIRPDDNDCERKEFSVDKVRLPEYDVENWKYMGGNTDGIF